MPHAPRTTALRLAAAALLALLACTPPRHRALAGPPASASAPARPAAAAPMHFAADYPATLLYALDAAAGQRNRDAGYRAWLVGDEHPAWLADYAARRRAWNEPLRPDAGGGTPAYEACAWQARELGELLACVERVLVEPSDRALALAALREADARLRPRWTGLSAQLGVLRDALRATLATRPARELVALLRRESALDDGVALDFRVVLVAKPPGRHTYARQAGQFLVHEVGPDETAGSLVATAFHEITHLAHFMSPRRDALERSLAARGDPGLLAANVWDEVVATAFGQGLAAERLDPRARPTRSMYDDPWIDRLGRALYLAWREGADVRLGPALAARLVALVEREWPANERPMGRCLWYATVYASDEPTTRAALAGVHYRAASRMAPIDDALPRGAELPAWSPRVVLVTADELAARPALAARAGLAAGDARDALARAEAAVFRRDGSAGDDAPIFVITARDPSVLRRAGAAFARYPSVVPPGWTELPLEPAADATHAER